MTIQTTVPRTALTGPANPRYLRLVQKKAFFPDKGGSTRDAKRVCHTCPIRRACLEYALNHDERFGIWGGMSERERRALRRRRKQRHTTGADVGEGQQ
ncbi:MAG: hypothetical protein GEU83_20825 [Pseudonocardiaceae bacterium]|nr:hypothetical protein [Pseudonocardiaceae bacterium]